MAKECFCGCGRRLGFNDRSLSKKGEKIESLVRQIDQEWRPIYVRGGHSEEALDSFIEEGRDYRDKLVGVIHRELDARAVDRPRMNRWFKGCLQHGARTPRDPPGPSRLVQESQRSARGA